MNDETKQGQLAKLGDRIRAQREICGLRLHELARLTGISASALSLIETGKRDLRVSSLYFTVFNKILDLMAITTHIYRIR